MADNRITEYRDELQGRLRQAGDAYQRAQAASRDIGSVTDGFKCDIRLPYLDDIVQSVLECWLKGLLQGYTAANQGIGTASLDLDDLEADLKRLRRSDDREVCVSETDPWHEQVNQMLSNYDFAALVQALDSRSDALEDRGLNEAADAIVRILNFHSRWTELRPTRRGRFLLLRQRIYFSYGSYDHSAAQGMYDLARALEVAERDSGLSGLSVGAFAAHQAFRSMGYDQRFPSRTVLGEQSAMPYTVFKDKVEYKLALDDADTLLAFLKIHASDKFQDDLAEAA